MPVEIKLQFPEVFVVGALYRDSKLKKIYGCIAEYISICPIYREKYIDIFDISEEIYIDRLFLPK